MITFKTLGFAFSLLCISLSAMATEHPFQPLPQEQYPEQTVVPYGFYKLEPDYPAYKKGWKVIPEEVQVTVTVSFSPDSLSLELKAPKFLPPIIDELITNFKEHFLKGGTAESYSQLEDFPIIRGKAYKNGELMGNTEFQASSLPQAFFKTLEEKFKEVRRMGFLAVCEHNSGLAHVLGKILQPLPSDQGAEEDLTYSNMRELARLLTFSRGMSFQEKETSFTLSSGENGPCISLQAEEAQQSCRKKMRNFISPLFSPEEKEGLTTLLKRLKKNYILPGTSPSVIGVPLHDEP